MFSFRAADAVQEALKQGESKLLCNHLDDLIEYLLSEQSPAPDSRIDIVTDNAGFELVSDLCLADILIACGVAKKVTFSFLRPLRSKACFSLFPFPHKQFALIRKGCAAFERPPHVCVRCNGQGRDGHNFTNAVR